MTVVRDCVALRHPAFHLVCPACCLCVSGGEPALDDQQLQGPDRPRQVEAPQLHPG